MTGNELDNATPQPLSFEALSPEPIPDTPGGYDQLPMPRGINLRFQPMLVRPSDYGCALVDGECSKCGDKPAHNETLQLEATAEGMALIHQCRGCGTQSIMLVATASRPNPQPMNGKAG